jgi:6-phosphogluconolactonase/glucosamine-6-phosphate isomerase/deaminase
MAQLKQADGTEVPSFDMILLGMGADGHIGSIYAGSPVRLLLTGQCSIC